MQTSLRWVIRHTCWRVWWGFWRRVPWAMAMRGFCCSPAGSGYSTPAHCTQWNPLAKSTRTRRWHQAWWPIYRALALEYIAWLLMVHNFPVPVHCYWLLLVPSPALGLHPDRRASNLAFGLSAWNLFSYSWYWTLANYLTTLTSCLLSCDYPWLYPWPCYYPLSATVAEPWLFKVLQCRYSPASPNFPAGVKGGKPGEASLVQEHNSLFELQNQGLAVT